MTTPAHYQNLVLNETLRLWYPEHEPREDDPLYRLFHQAKARMKKLDVPCWRCGVHYKDLNPALGQPSTEANPLSAHQLEAHHYDVEFSLANGIDVERWWAASMEQKNEWFVQTYSDVAGFLRAHPELDPSNHDDVFKHWLESEGNLMQLCDVCHRSNGQGVHHIPLPEWRPLAVWRRTLPAHIQA